MEKLCKPRATWNEVGLHLCWKWVLCLVVFVMCLCLVMFGCVSMRYYVIVCVVFVCVVGCRRCVGFCVAMTVQKKKKKKNVCNFKKNPAREFISITVLIN